MKKVFCMLYITFIIFCQIENENIGYLTEGYYEIQSHLNKNYISVMNKKQLIISNINFSFHITPISNLLYIIKCGKKKLGIDDYDNIILYHKTNNIEVKKYIWKIYNIKRNMFYIQNIYNSKLLEVDDNNIIMSDNNLYNYEKFLFRLFKLCEKGLNQNKHIKKINKEPIDVVIKYIDLTDRTLNRTGINQIYKDDNCEELKYSIRSILLNIPWIRKIYILMPNKKVKFLKNEINEKIIYIKDKDILGFDSANSPAFSFSLFKMKKFGISKNFIYMDDDCFIGKKIKKSDLFYFDEKCKEIVPYIISNEFFTINKIEIYNEYYELMKKKDYIHPHSGEGFNLEKLCTQKFFIDRYNTSLINCKYTHNAFPHNIEDLKDIFDLSQNYKYFKEMIYSKERFIFSFYHQMFTNLYQLNVNYRKVHNIRNKYISVENVKKKIFRLNSSLFVLNTGGNHEPNFREKKILKNIMEKRFPFLTKYEIKSKEHKINYINIKFYIQLFIISLQIKIIKLKFL